MYADALRTRAVSLFSAFLQQETNYTCFDITGHPIWILGQQYDGTQESELVSAKADVQSRVWLTYRCNFSPLSGSCQYTSDKGWGCMLRCGQMLLAEAMSRRHLGRSWRWGKESREADYLQLVSMFEDNIEAPFSLHVMTAMGCTVGKDVGEWYGPNTVAHLIKKLPEFDMWNKFVVCVVNNNTLFVEETRNSCKESHPNGWDPLLVIVPQRLGINAFNIFYQEYLQSMFRIPQCLGVLGGTPSHALFLIGYIGDEVIYLDPHTTQDSVCIGKKMRAEEFAADETYHCNNTPHMPIAHLDPSLAVCFLCNSELEFRDLIKRLRSNENSCKLLEVMECMPDYMKEEITSMTDANDSTTQFTNHSATSSENKLFHQSSSRCKKKVSSSIANESTSHLENKFFYQGSTRCTRNVSSLSVIESDQIIYRRISDPGESEDSNNSTGVVRRRFEGHNASVGFFNLFTLDDDDDEEEEQAKISESDGQQKSPSSDESFEWLSL